MPSIVNKLVAEEYRKRFKGGRHFFVANVKGVSGIEDNKFRVEMRKNGIKVAMLKNRIVRRVLKEEGLETLASVIQGQVVIFVGEDPVKTAKAAVDMQKSLKTKLSIRGGWLEGKVLSVRDIEVLATIPPIEVLYSMLVGAVKSPLTRLVQVLNAIPRKLVAVLDKAAGKKAEAEKASESAKTNEPAAPSAEAKPSADNKGEPIK